MLEAAGFDPALGPALVRGDRGLPENPGLALVAVDPPAIQQLVLASRRAVTRKGASDRLAAWDTDLRAWQGDLAALGPVAPLYAGGGQAVLLSTVRHAATVAEGLRARFQKRLFGRLGAAVLPVSPRMLVEGPAQPEGSVVSSLGKLGLRSPTRGFGALLSPLMARLRADKDAAVPTQPVAGRRCAECGTRSASERGPDGTTRVCEACAIFRQNGGREDLVTFADLGEGRVLAYLYVDGTGIGSKLAGLGSLAEYERFSSALLRAFDYEGVVLPAMERAGHRSRDEVVPVLRGGDDLLLVLGATSGRGAFAATVELVAGIERALDDGGYDDVGVGVGLVVSAHLQARQGFDLAKKLLQSAKVRARRSGARSGIDFEVVQGGAVLGESLEAIREDRERPVENPAPWPAGRKLRLHRRPLLLDEARALLETSEHLEEDQRAVLYRLEEELRRDMLAGLSAATYALARQDATLAQGLTGHARPPVPGPTVDLGLLCAPFDEGKVKGWSTAIPDLLDLHRITRGSRP
ncbi:hypothetical protein L6R53_16725 [Myxococcota bacterium]|nr:hypothetical protein [Myxococcota bacterium]